MTGTKVRNNPTTSVYRIIGHPHVAQTTARFDNEILLERRAFPHSTAASRPPQTAEAVCDPEQALTAAREDTMAVTFNVADLTFILQQIQIAEANATTEDANGAPVAGTPLSELIPNGLLPWGLRTVDGTYNNLGDGRDTWGSADQPFPRLLDPVFDPAYAPENTFVVDGAPRTISNLIVDQSYHNPAALIAAFTAIGSADPNADAQTILDAIVTQAEADANLVAAQTTLTNANAALAAAAAALDVNVPATVDALQAAIAAAGVAAENFELAQSLAADPEAGLMALAAEMGLTINPDTGTVFIPNIAPDEGISASFNSMFTLFGQFFDHGLDLVGKGGNGIVFIPLQPDDPLYDPTPGANNFIIVTRATNQPGPDGVLGTADDIQQHNNSTTPFVDQNQTYTSHASHQVFLREYVLDGNGLPVATGHLLEGAGGGLATWADIKQQAAEMLGIQLTDADVTNVPLLATDEYGRFLRGPNGYAQVVVDVGLGTDGIDGTDDDYILVEGDPAANGGLGISLTDVGALGGTVVRTGHAFIDDIAHAAAPYGDHDGNPGTPNQLLTPDDDDVAGGSLDPVALGQYDDELLDAHFITGDGRGNENIGLTAIHHVFHSEHNRLAEQVKDIVISSGDLDFINQWLVTPLASLADIPADIDTLDWNGERLFQAARFGTEMQYQHMVFEEFARTVNPMIDLFVFNPTMDINPAIFAEFAHVIYRFGHSMLTDTVDRLDADGQTTDDIGLIEAFLNPIEFLEGGTVTADQAAGAIIRGMSRQVGNEIDEFITDALRNNLLGLPLDLAAINIARGRDTGMPSLNEARAQLFSATQSEWLRPYTSWADYAANISNPASIINFIAAYGTHFTITGATTLEEKRNAAMELVLGIDADNDGDVADGATAQDIQNFLNGTGDYAANLGGLNDVDLWIGGLAEAILPFGGMLGSTFTAVFEAQLQNLQNGDRFYYLSRTQGMHFLTELENNSFTSIIMANTDLGAPGHTHLPGLVFATPQFTLEVNQALQNTPDPVNPDPNVILDMVERGTNVTLDGTTYDNMLAFHGGEHVVIGGTDGTDILIGDLGDDTIWGDGGDDYIIGGHGINRLHGGDGDDIIWGGGDPEFIHGEAGDDVIHAGNGLGDLVFAGDGNDFVVAGEDGTEVFGAQGNDFILGTPDMDFLLGGEGDDWLEGGEGFDTLAGDNSELFFNSTVIGHDVMFAGTNENDFDAESGDDIMVQGESVMRNEGMLGFDWVTFQEHTFGVTVNMNVRIFTTVFDDILRNRFDRVEALSGTGFDDIIIGDDRVSPDGPFNQVVPVNEQSLEGDELTREGVERIAGLQEILGLSDIQLAAFAPTATVFDDGNILLGGGGSDTISGNGGDDIIDGDAHLHVRIGVHAIIGGVSVEIGTAPSMQGIVEVYDAFLNVIADGETQPLGALDGRPLDDLMFERAIDGENLHIVREILDGGQTGDVDIATFRGNQADYIITFNGDGTITVVHNIVPGGGANAIFDGTDTLRNIEVLQFADGVVLNGVTNAAPTGAPALIDSTGGVAQVGDTFTVALGTLADTDGVPAVSTFAVAWQVEQTPGLGDWIAIEDPITEAPITGLSFTATAAFALDGLRIRAQVTYVGVNNGVPEVVTTAPTNALVLTVSTTPTTGDDVITGTLNPDVIDALAGNDQVFGLDGDDVLTGGPGDDLLDGGDGADTASFEAATTPITVDLGITVAQITGDGTDTLISIENVIGGSAADSLQGNGDANTLDGRDGADSLLGGNGGDTLLGGAGTDLLMGGLGDDLLDGGADADFIDGEGGVDTVSFASNTTGVIVDLDPLSGFSSEGDLLLNIENALGGSGGDTILGSFQNNVIDGAGGADSLLGGNGNDTFLLGADGANDTVDGQGGTNDSIEFTGATGVTVTFDAVTEGSGTASGGGVGTDTFAGIERAVGTVAGDILTGGAGAQTLEGGGGGDTISGGDGHDVIVGGTGSDNMSGGAGNDLFNADADGEIDTIDGGAGNDLLNLTNASGPVTVNFSATVAGSGTASGGGLGTDTFTGIERVRGSNFGDTINGGANAQNLDGAGGADTITGGDGNDIMNGGDGEDSLSGGGGNDLVYVDADGDDDTFAGDGGSDTIDFAFATSGVNVTFADVGSGDASGGGIGNDTFTGIERVAGSQFDDEITGSAGAEYLTGRDGDDVVDGGGGNDTILGGNGSDELIGGGGNDVFNADADAASDTIDGGTGTDAIDFQFVSGGIFVTFDATVAGAGTASGASIGADTFTNIERVRGTNDGDVLTGGAGGQNLDGGGGSDIMSGGDGNDVMNGGAGSDTLAGDGGNDLFYADADSANDTIAGGTGTDTIDFLFASGGVNVTFDAVVSGTGVATGGGVGTDSFTSIERIAGSNSGDTIIGGSGSEFIMSRGGNDTLSGGGGADMLQGGEGADTMSGGSGNDTFIFDTATGADGDVITDFQPGDRINLSFMDAIDNILGGTANDDFALVGSFSGAAGQLVISNDGTNSFIEGDTDGNSVADFRIQVNGLPALSGANIVF